MNTILAHTGREYPVTGLAEAFRELAVEYVDCARAAGVTTLPYRDPALTHFGARSQDEQIGVIDALSRSVKICQTVRSQGDEVSNSPALIWAALKEFQFHPPSDLFHYLNTTCVIEIHSLHGIQLFRNFNFYKYCSYTLEELYCVPWFRLFERDAYVTDAMIAAATQVFEGKTRHVVPMDVPSHFVRERFSVNQNAVRLDMRWIAPLFTFEGAPGATIVVESIDPVQQAGRQSAMMM